MISNQNADGANVQRARWRNTLPIPTTGRGRPLPCQSSIAQPDDSDLTVSAQIEPIRSRGKRRRRRRFRRQAVRA